MLKIILNRQAYALTHGRLPAEFLDGRTCADSGGTGRLRACPCRRTGQRIYPYDYGTPDQDYGYGQLTERRIWRLAGQDELVDGRPTLERIFGFSWWCYDGSGLTHQAIRFQSASRAIPSRLFLVNNVERNALNLLTYAFGHVDEGKLLL